MATEQVQATDRILVYNVHTTISDNDLRKELLTTYQGVKHVRRLYHNDEFERPKRLVQIEFTLSKYAEQFLQDGFINIGNLRCQVKGINPTMRVQNQLKSDNGSDYQSEILTEEPQTTDKILIHDVPTTIIETDLRKELWETYPGIKHIKRWYHMNVSQGATERVQIDFMSPKDTERILQNGFIDIGRLCCAVTALKPSKRLQNQFDSDYGSDYQSEMFTEAEVITDKIIVCNVPVTINEHVLLQKLSKKYPGMMKIRRWCFDDRCQYPMVCVQIDFASSIYTEAILRNGFITNDNIIFKVVPLKSSRRLRTAFGSDSGSDYQSQMFTD